MVRSGPPGGRRSAVNVAEATEAAVDLERTTPNVRTSRSASGAPPCAVALASIVIVCLPTDRVGSGTETSLNALPENRVGARPSDGAATVKTTGSPA